MAITVQVLIKVRADTSANWTANNPVLFDKEQGFDLTTKQFKIGDGVTHWNSLPYWGGGGTGGDPIIQDVPVGSANPYTLAYDGSLGDNPTNYVEQVLVDGSTTTYIGQLTLNAARNSFSVTVADDGTGHNLDHYQIVIKA